jgi:UDP-3-O-[3-hydroxymyristoyl] N-acetylglucosamine deacetylase
MRKRNTLKSEVSFSGVGLHSGKDAKVILKPREEEGILLVSGGACHELSDAVMDGTGRGTVLTFEDGSSYQTVEHLFASFAGLGIDDVEIFFEAGREIPALDGCSEEMVHILKKAGIQEKEREISCIVPYVPFGLDSENGDKAIWVFPADRTSYTFIVSFDSPGIGTQAFSFVPGSLDFELEVAPARTFCFEEEVDILRSRGLAMGGSLDNAIVVGEDSVKAKGGLRFSDEFARHKLLDLMGDLFLVGAPLKANIVAWRSGHKLNTDFASRLKRKFTRYGG